MLSATESTGLDHWLHDHHYTIPDGAEPLLRPYIEQGMKWFVAKVDPKKVAFDPKTKMATLSPLRFSYDSSEFALPIRLGLANSNGTQDLIINILAPGDTRYEAANYPNVLIPTNLPVNDSVRTQFGEFYAALFDHTIDAQPHAVVTEYAWSTSNCDPCPGPVLDGNDLATFGADVLGARYQNVNNFTLTRLHARYGKDLASDLVFRAVDPIEGGRASPTRMARCRWPRRCTRRRTTSRVATRSFTRGRVRSRVRHRVAASGADRRRVSSNDRSRRRATPRSRRAVESSSRA